MREVITRPACLDRVPEWVEAFLASTCPKSPTGAHQWLASATHKTFPYLEATEQEAALRWGMRDCGRAPQPHEIESTVVNIRARRSSGQFNRTFPSAWSPVVYDEVDRLVQTGIRAKQLRRKSPDAAQRTTFDWLSWLFPANSLLCLSAEYVYGIDPLGVPLIGRRWHTRRRENWRRYSLDQFPLLVPNLAAYTWHYKLDGGRSTRCSAMFPLRRYLVVECDFSLLARDGKSETHWAPYVRKWEKRGRSVKDACAAILDHLSQYAPLVLVVWSGNKSSQGWFDADGQPEATLRRFFDYGHMLGADSATWTKCQLVRTPEALRHNGNRQSVEYFDPQYLPDER